MIWDEDLKVRVIIATRDIEENQEICHNYLKNVYDYQSRQQELLQRWNFTCSCVACDTETDLSIMMKLETIQNQINNKQKVTNLSTVLNYLEMEDYDNQIRIVKVLKVLDNIYNNICLTHHYSKQLVAKSSQIATTF